MPGEPYVWHHFFLPHRLCCHCSPSQVNSFFPAPSTTNIWPTLLLLAQDPCEHLAQNFLDWAAAIITSSFVYLERKDFQIWNPYACNRLLIVFVFTHVGQCHSLAVHTIMFICLERLPVLNSVLFATQNLVVFVSTYFEWPQLQLQNSGLVSTASTQRPLSQHSYLEKKDCCYLCRHRLCDDSSLDNRKFCKWISVQENNAHGVYFQMGAYLCCCTYLWRKLVPTPIRNYYRKYLHVVHWSAGAIYNYYFMICVCYIVKQMKKRYMELIASLFSLLRVI